MSDTNIEITCSETLKNLLEKYKDNEYMYQRLYSHVVNYLPNTLEIEMKNHEERVNRNNFLTNEQKVFIKVFLNKNKYYYLSNNNFFYYYDGEKYLIIKEDDIIHKILTTISKDRVLIQWKYKTKISIINLIKERSLFSCIPETDTIQNVLNAICPSYFTSKNSAKYFLTIIGDNIHKKSSHLIFYISQQMKQFINEVDNVAVLSIGHSNVTNNFMVKYHENHSYENCRLIKINNYSNNVWRELLKKIGLDMMCVSAYYSSCYENSDKFIETKVDEELKTYTYYLKNNKQEYIANEFCNKFILDNNNDNNDNNDNKLEWKNIHFLWKQFLSDNNLPNIMYTTSLKNILKEKYTYDEVSDSFKGITSKYLPIYRDFINFWNSTIKIDTELSNNNFYNELEIDEICSLFKIKTKQSISEEIVLKILTHFFPNIEIVDNKFILNVRSIYWDKNEDIYSSFEFIKNKILHLDDDSNLVPIDDIYNYYKECCYHNSMRLLVSKRYFENYIYYKLPNYIVYDKFINTNWIFN